MLSVNDYNHLKLLYENLEKMNLNLRELILSKDWDSVLFAVQDKNVLMEKIVKFEKPRIPDIKENEFLHKTRVKLFEAEKENLELVKKMKEDMLAEFKNVKKAKKVLNTYEPYTAQTVSTIDVSSDD